MSQSLDVPNSEQSVYQTSKAAPPFSVALIGKSNPKIELYQTNSIVNNIYMVVFIGFTLFTIKYIMTAGIRNKCLRPPPLAVGDTNQFEQEKEVTERRTDTRGRRGKCIFS